MSLSSNGNDLKHHTYCFPIEEETQIGQVRRFATLLSERLQFNETRKGRVGIIVSELCTNLLKYSKDGEILVRIIDRGVGLGLEFLTVDRGPGIEDIEQAMSDGFSTGQSAGIGLGAIKRQSDQFDIFSIPAKGTIILSVIFAHDNQKQPLFNYGAISIPIHGEVVCGDAWCSTEKEDSLDILMSDGLGHGPLAEKASLDAISELKNNKAYPVDQILKKIDGRLKGSRGAAVFLLRWHNRKKIDYVSLGNIRAVIQTQEKMKTLISQNGTAGLRIPNLKVFNQDWSGEGFLILHSDGINTRWDLSTYPGLMNCHPGIIAGLIYRDFSRNSDDATVFVLKGSN